MKKSRFWTAGKSLLLVHASYLGLPKLPDYIPLYTVSYPNIHDSPSVMLRKPPIVQNFILFFTWGDERFLKSNWLFNRKLRNCAPGGSFLYLSRKSSDWWRKVKSSSASYYTQTHTHTYTHTVYHFDRYILSELRSKLKVRSCVYLHIKWLMILSVLTKSSTNFCYSP
jgi:hypothetical protein